MRAGYERAMGIPVSLLLIAAGAILTFAVTATTTGVDLHVVGWILMAAGAVGLLVSLILWEGFRPAAPTPRRPPRP